MSATASSTEPTRSRKSRDVLRSAVLATIALGVVALVMGASQGGPAYFIQLGQKSRALELARDVLGDDVPTPVADGHDGENFWLLARDPTLSGGEDLAQYFDRPLYRAQRIGYPALVAPWRLGGEQALVWGLVLTNLAAVGIGTFLTGANVARQGGARLAGYVFAANPLVWLALLFDFSDAVALAGVMGAVWALRRGRWGPLVACTVVAALAKESSLLGLGAIAVLVPRLPLRQRALLVVPAGLSAAVWRLYVMAQPGFTSDPQVEEFVIKPFSGYVEAWPHSWSPMGDWAYAAVSIALIPVAVVIIWAWWRHRSSVELCAALPYALFLPFLSGQVLDVPINSVRAVGPAITLAAAGVLIIRGTAAGTPPPVPILGADGATSRRRHDP